MQAKPLPHRPTVRACRKRPDGRRSVSRFPTRAFGSYFFPNGPARALMQRQKDFPRGGYLCFTASSFSTILRLPDVIW
jgi:hypothetical protein